MKKITLLILLFVCAISFGQDKVSTMGDNNPIYKEAQQSDVVQKKAVINQQGIQDSSIPVVSPVEKKISPNKNSQDLSVQPLKQASSLGERNANYYTPNKNSQDLSVQPLKQASSLGERNAQFVKDKTISQPRPHVPTGSAVMSVGIDFPLYVVPKKLQSQNNTSKKINVRAPYDTNGKSVQQEPKVEKITLPFETEREILANNLAQANQPEYVMKKSSYDGVRSPMADIIPTAGATETFTPNVGDNFFDPGGPGGSSTGGTPGNYPNCACTTLTTLAGVTEILFNDFSVFATFDWLRIYDSADTTGAVLYDNGSGGANSGDITLADMIASNGSAMFVGASGDMTFEFFATGVVDYGGWDSTITVAGGGGGGACITEDFEAYVPPVGGAEVLGTATMDETTIANGQGPGLVEDGCVYSSLGADLQWNDAGYFGQVSRNILSNDNTLTLVYDTTVDAVDFNLSAFDGFADSATIEAFDGGGISLGVVGPLAVPDSTPVPVSFAVAGIKTITIVGTNSWSPLINDHVFCPEGGGGGGGGTADNVLYLNHDGDAVWTADVVTQLTNAGVPVVDVWDGTLSMPTLTDLQAYDAVLIDTNFAPGDPVALGDVLASFADGGGGIVEMLFSADVTFGIGGNFAANYSLWASSGIQSGAMRTLGTVLDPAHPIMQGVTTFSGGATSFNLGGAAKNGGVVIAEYDNGNSALVVNDNIGPGNARTAYLNFYPPSDATGSTILWDSTTDGGIWMKNALDWVANTGGGGGGGAACNQSNPSNAFENAFTTSTNQAQIMGTDITVDADSDLSLETITVNLMVNPGETIASADITLYNDAAGLPDPASIVSAQPGVVPSAQAVIGTAFGLDVIEAIFDITPTMLAGQAGVSTQYWTSLYVTTSAAGNAFIESTTATIVGSDHAFSADAGVTWGINAGWDTVYDFAGECTAIGGGGGMACDQENLSNAFENAFTTSTNQAQIMGTDITVDADSDLSLETITVNLMVNPGETIASADITLYNDGAGLPDPASIVSAQPGVVPSAQAVIGTAFGLDVIEAIFDITPTMLAGQAGVSTQYWTSLYVTTSAAGNAFIESTTATIVGSDHAFSADAGVTWGINAGWDTVYNFAGECTPIGGGGGCMNPGSLPTTLAGGNGNFGNMFDVNALADLTIDSFDIHGDTGAVFDVDVYAKTGTHVGFEADASAWTLIGTAPGVVSNGDGVITPLDLELNYAMLAGETHAFFVTPTDTSTGGFNYTNGTNVGDVFSSDANIEFLEGAAAGIFNGTVFSPRIFNGNILYCADGAGGGCMDPGDLATTLAGGNGNFGNMFDVNALNDITMESFDIHGDTGAVFDVDVYAKTGTHVGFEADASAWTLIGTAPGVVSNGDGVTTPLDLALGYAMIAGETHAFFVTPTDTSTGGFNYTNGTTVGAVFASDANIEFLEGSAAGIFNGTIFSPRVFNGNLLYCADGGGGGGTACTEENANNAFENGFTYTAGSPFTVANDVTVAADEEFLMAKITYESFHNIGETVASVDINYYVDAAGLPGALVGSQAGVVPTTQAVIGSNFGFDVSSVELDITPQLFLGQAGVPTTYWVEFIGTSSAGGPLFWNVSSAGANGNASAQSNAGVFAIPDPTLDGVYIWEGDCLPLGTTPQPPPNDMIANSIDVDVIGFPYTDPSVQMDYATTEAGTPADCDNAGARGVWYHFTPTGDGTSTASIVTPAGFSSVTYYTAPNETSVETDLTLVDWFENQCLPGTTASIPLVAGQTYYVYVANHDGVTDIVIDATILGTDENTIEGFSFYPNPSTSIVNLSSVELIETVSIYNMLGQQVIAQEIDATTSEVNVSKLATGTYLMKVTVNGQVGTYRILKQ